jgi:hypothetical protein
MYKKARPIANDTNAIIIIAGQLVTMSPNISPNPIDNEFPNADGTIDVIFSVIFGTQYMSNIGVKSEYSSGIQYSGGYGQISTGNAVNVNGLIIFGLVFALSVYCFHFACILGSLGPPHTYCRFSNVLFANVTL